MKLSNRYRPNYMLFQTAEEHRQLGAQYYNIDTLKSLAAYTRAIELDPADLDAHEHLGLLLSRIGNLDTAKEIFDRILKLAERSGDKYWQRRAIEKLTFISTQRDHSDSTKQTIMTAATAEQKRNKYCAENNSGPAQYARQIQVDTQNHLVAPTLSNAGRVGSTDSQKHLKVFISYSRNDIAFADTLAEELEAHDIDILIDRRDLPYGEEWKPELLDFVRSADAVVFIVSRRSIASRWCLWEVEQVKFESKRLVPILIENLVPEELPSQIADIHLLSFTHLRDAISDNLQELKAQIRTLAKILHTDRSWVKEHTRFGDLARRWQQATLKDSADRAEALLIRGDVLAEAELWISRRPREAPEPTDLQRQYIQASRKNEQARLEAEARRGRRRTYLAIAASIVMAGLCILTYISYSEASKNFILALLAKADELLINEQPTRALTVAGSLQRQNIIQSLLGKIDLLHTNSEKAVRVDTIAQVASPASNEPLKTWKNSSPTTSIAFNHDGTQFAAGYNNGTIIVMQISGSVKPLYLKGHSSRIWNLKFGPSGRWLVSSTFREILLWDLQTKKSVSLCDEQSEIIGLNIDPTGRYLAWTTRDGRIGVRDLYSRDTKVFEEHARRALAVEFSADGKLIVSTGDDGTIAIRSTKDWALLRKFNTKRVDLVGLAISTDGTRIATASLAGPVDIWHLESDMPENTGIPLNTIQDKRWKIKYSPDGRWLALASWQGKVQFWDAETLQYRGTIDGHDLRVNDIAFSKSAPLILTASESGVVRMWDLNRIQPMFLSVPNDGRETIIGKYSDDGKLFVAGGKDGYATLYRVDDTGQLSPKCRVQHSHWVFSIAFSPDSKIVVSVGPNQGTAMRDGVKMWDTDSCNLINTTIDINHSLIRRVAFSPSGKEIALSSRKGDIWLFDTSGTPRTTKLPRRHKSNIGEIDFSPDGRFLVSGGLDGKVLVWDLKNKKVHRELRGHRPGAYVYTVRFGANGDFVASSGTENKVLVWNLRKEKGKELIKELPLKGGANRLAFSRDGTILAVGSGARSISMWSVSNWRKIFQLNALVGIRSVYDFHPTRGDIAFDGEKGFIRILRKQTDTKIGLLPENVFIDGMDVYFDRIPTNLTPPKQSKIIQGPLHSCISTTGR